MRELEPAQQIHLGEIPETELVPQPAEDNLEHDIGRQLEEVERSAGSLIGFPPAGPTEELGVAEVGGLAQLPNPGRLAMGADHGATVSQFRVADSPPLSLPRPES